MYIYSCSAFDSLPNGISTNKYGLDEKNKIMGIVKFDIKYQIIIKNEIF